MSDFQFKNEWLGFWLAVGGILPLFLYGMDRLAAKRGTAFVSERMALRLVNRNPIWRTLLSYGSLGAAMVFLGLALMRPQWGLIPQVASRAGAEVMICLDVSRSMLAEDVSPSRLQRAKAEIRDLLGYLEGEQVGLMVFAGRPVLLSPLTSDFGFLKLVLEAAGPHTVGRGGTRLEPAIQRALAAFQETDEVSKVVVLITDGGETEAETGLAARLAKRRDVRLIIIGFGDEAGTTIESTDPRTGERRTIEDQDGRPVVSRLDTALLRQLAEVTEGVYIPAGTGTLDLADLHRVHFAPLIRAQHQAVEREYRFEGFQIPLSLAVLSLVFACWAQAVPHPKQSPQSGIPLPRPPSKRILTSGVPTLLCAIIMSFIGRDDYAVEQGSSKAPTEAKSVFDKFRQGVDLIKTDREQSRELFEEIYTDPDASQAMRFQAIYNLGWLAASEGDRLLSEDPRQALVQLERSRDAFQDAIEINPDHIPARQNLEVVALRAKQLREAQDPSEDAASQALDELTQQQRELNQKMEKKDQERPASQDEGQKDDEGSAASQDPSDEERGEETNERNKEQEELARKAKDLAEQLRKEAEARSPESNEDENESAANGEKDTGKKPNPQDAAQQAANEIESAAEEMSKAANSTKREGLDSEEARNFRENALENLEKARQMLGQKRDEEKKSGQEQESKPEEQQEQMAMESGKGQTSDQEVSGISQLLQLIRDREAQRIKDQGKGRWTADEPVAEDW
jgi:von Willebrand factor type A domain